MMARRQPCLGPHRQFIFEDPGCDPCPSNGCQGSQLEDYREFILRFGKRLQKRNVAMGNTLVLWPEVEVENSGSGCAHEMQIEIRPAPETRRSGYPVRLTVRFEFAELVPLMSKPCPMGAINRKE